MRRSMGRLRPDELSDLLERNQEGTLEDVERRRLDDLMRDYRAGLVRKAQGLRLP